MKNTTGERVLVSLALLACLSACADSVTRSTEPALSRDITANQATGSSTPERAALTKITRLVALAMDNQPARQHLKRDMKAAPFREHKLQLAGYLQSKDGRALLERMVAANGGTERDLLETLAGVRPLEFYMPVRKHRESWTGNGEVLVVSHLEESDPIVAFDAKGTQLALDQNTPPEQPALSIVPVETRFDQPLPSGSKNVGDQSGNAIGTLEPMAIKGSSLIACGAECGGGGGGSGGSAPSIAPGIYMEFSRILDLKEPWTRGEPEIEVHIQGPTSTSAPRAGEDLSCSGEHAYQYPKVFNQDNGFWEGRVMLFSRDETNAFISKFNQGFHVLFWEDDNDPCTLKLDSNALIGILTSTATATVTVAIKVLPGSNPYLVAAVFFGTFFASAGDWLLTNDDFVGAAVDQASAGYYYPGNTHVIMDGTRLNGRATIVYRQ
jgi:hypothetical protein